MKFIMLLLRPVRWLWLTFILPFFPAKHALRRPDQEREEWLKQRLADIRTDRYAPRGKSKKDWI